MNEKQETSAVSTSAPALYVLPTHNRFIFYSVPLLWSAIIALFILNIITFFGLNQARLSAVEALNKIELALEDLTAAKITYDIEVDEIVPVQADVPFSYNANLPIDLVIPVDQSLEVPVQIPTGDQIILDVPLKADFPVNEMIPININETTRVDTVVYIDATVPIEIDIAQTPLASYLNRARVDIAQLKERLAFQ